MKTLTIKIVMAGILISSGLFGCGGGGGGGGSAGTTNVAGVASKGIIYPGTINVYALDASGNKGALLAGPVATDINGKYHAALGGYSGAIVVEASGTYTDEATGRVMSVAPSAALHAMAEKVNWTTDNNRAIAITPLTEIAWRKANANGTKPTAPAIAGANKLVGDLFKVNDILGTEPVRPDNASMSSVIPDAQTYTLALATISAMASTASGATDAARLESVLARMALEVAGAETSGSMSSAAISDFNAAMGTVPLCADFPLAAGQLSSMGKKSQTITLATSGTLPAGTQIYAIEGSIAVPANVSIRADSTGRVLSYAFAPAGAASSMGAVPVANYMKLQQQVDFTIQIDPTKTGIGLGDFATVTYETATGATVTAADFSLISGSAVAVDANGATIGGVTVTIK